MRLPLPVALPVGLAVAVALPVLIESLKYWHCLALAALAVLAVAAAYYSRAGGFK